MNDKVVKIFSDMIKSCPGSGGYLSYTIPRIVEEVTKDQCKKHIELCQAHMAKLDNKQAKDAIACCIQSIRELINYD